MKQESAKPYFAKQESTVRNLESTKPYSAKPESAKTLYMWTSKYLGHATSTVSADLPTVSRVQPRATMPN